ncbi:hypothetical protein RchiOBHm_Chr1g0332141 [Rosa chinensis]|uniref:Transmembrane protein n=1 Tax=Rosa chinensis TaxID=74649 RepID=A0A2P6SBP6_ROSCH|nr:hypothetical protein RchiOBHm_Chr1g0332141 [Rosa chinensis]
MAEGGVDSFVFLHSHSLPLLTSYFPILLLAFFFFFFFFFGVGGLRGIEELDILHYRG